MANITPPVVPPKATPAPAPWELLYRDGLPITIACPGTGPRALELIAEVLPTPGEEHNTGRQLANAHLLVAARAMLWALELVIAGIDRTDERECGAATVALVRDAIAQAHGEVRP